MVVLVHIGFAAIGLRLITPGRKQTTADCFGRMRLLLGFIIAGSAAVLGGAVPPRRTAEIAGPSRIQQHADSTWLSFRAFSIIVMWRGELP